MEYHEETMSDAKDDGIPRGNYEWCKGGNYEWRKGWWNATRKLWMTQSMIGHREETMSDAKDDGIPRGNYEWCKGSWNAMRKLWVIQRIMECNRRKRRNSFSWEKCTYSSISSAWQFEDEDHYFSKIKMFATHLHKRSLNFSVSRCTLRESSSTWEERTEHIKIIMISVAVILKKKVKHKGRTSFFYQ